MRGLRRKVDMKKEKNARAEEAILSVNKSRREFIKTATAGAGGMAVYPLVSSSANASASSAKSFLSQKTVTVTFEGLMIFHSRRDVEEYEVGILALPRPHIFAIN